MGSGTHTRVQHTHWLLRVARAKYDSWVKLGDMAQDDAQAAYVTMVLGLSGGDLASLEQPDAESQVAKVSGGSSAGAGHGAERSVLESVAYPRGELAVAGLELSTILTSLSDAGVLTVTLNRPVNNKYNI